MPQDINSCVDSKTFVTSECNACLGMSELQWSAAAITCDHDVEHDAAGPDVRLLAVVLVGHEHFRSNVVGRAADSLWPGIHKLILAVAEVADLDIGLRLCVIQQSVLKLYVPAHSSKTRIATYK